MADYTRFAGLAGAEYFLFQAACPHFGKLEAKVGQEVAEYFASAPQPKIRVLELGPGPGYTTLEILEADPRTVVISVDNDPGMISQAQENLKDYIEQDRVSLILRDAKEFLAECPAHSFDAVAQGFCLHNLHRKDRDRALTGIARVLGSRGIFVSGDKYAQDKIRQHWLALSWQIYKFITVYIKMHRFDLVKEWVSHYLYDNRPQFRWHEGRAREQLEALGFTVKTTFRSKMDAVMVSIK